VSASFRLPAPVEREVAVGHGGAVLVAGGLAASNASTGGVFRLNVATGALTSLGSLPQVFHDAAGAVIGRALYVFGGGAAASSSAVQRFDLGSRTSAVVARLPHPLSDVASAATADSVYLVGGYDGQTPRREIYRTRDGVHFRQVATLPVGLRYPAVAAAGHDVVIAGGTAASGAVRSVFLLDTRTNRLSSFGRLPAATAHAEAFAVGGNVYVGGGVDAAGQESGSISMIDLAHRRIVRVAGTIPVHDAATVVLGRSVWILGGATSAGITGTVRRLTVR
jgi:N-acetylneuraminic acid mutarotase